ncbi:sporulation histidine kinase inhibitor Sda [Cohnella thermotolerans]|uniref:sporulation histidine kinase inhibitor Sda n=1 Tax=Cohnella thermotolerans TaxID=329858 RepID=UPI0004130B5C
MGLSTSSAKMNAILACLNDEHLIESYVEAQRLQLEPDFIDMLRSEITRRGLLSAIQYKALSY